MSSKTTALISLFSVLGIILGTVLGYYQPGLMSSLSFIGILYINGLKIIVIPLITALIITGIPAMGTQIKMYRSLRKTVLYFLSTGIIASIVGIVSAAIIQPGLLTSKEGAYIPSAMTRLYELSFSEMFGSILPDNIILSTAQGQMLGLVVFSILFAFAISSLGTTVKIVLDFFNGVKAVSLKLVHYFLFFAPLGLFSLSGLAVSDNYGNSMNVLYSLGLFTVTVLTGMLFFILVVLPLALKYIGKKSPVEFFSNLVPAITTALATGSSVASFPINYDCVAGKNKVDERATAFVLPLGSVINLNGTAIYLGAAAIFIAQLYGIDLSFLQILLIIGASLMVSIGSSLIPHTSLMMLAVVMSFADFPPRAYAGLGLLLVLDWMYERIRTVVNVAGDAVGAAVVGESFEFKTARKTKLTRSKPITSIRERSTRSRSGPDKRDSKPVTTRERKPYKKVEQTKRETKPDRKTTTRKTAVKKIDRKTTQSAPSPFVMPEVPYHTLDKEFHAKDDVSVKTTITPDEKNIKKATETPVKKNVRKTTRSPLPKVTKVPVPPYLKKPDRKSITVKPETEQKNNIISGNKSLSQSTIERERARISAQLSAMKDKEKNKNYLSVPPKIEKTEPTPPEIENAPEIQKDKSLLSGVDFLSDELEKPTELEKPAELEKPEKSLETDSEETTVIKEAVEEKKVSYGRSKPRRGAAFKKDDEEKTEKIKPEPDSTEETPIDKDTYTVDKMTFGRSKRKK